MKAPAGPLSPPASVTSSEWSRPPALSRDPYSPPLSAHRRGDLITPPVSGHLSDMNGSSGIVGYGGMGPRPTDHRGNPSPPMSMRLSSATTMSIDGQRRKQAAMEESLAQHYAVLKRYLAQSLKDEASDGKPNRARDKLLRLSSIQFQELSTDVYDELLRRQAAANQAGPGAPAFLLPKDNFHPKRNQARQKLSTLPSPRFRALATDVFYELERRIPQFVAGDIERRGSPANSLRGPPSRTGTPTGMRPGSRDAQPPRRLGPAPRQGSFGGHVMSGLGMPVAAGPDDFDRPTPKLSQSNTVVPNKSYLVEDDDDESDSVFGTQRNTGTTNRSFDVAPPADPKALVDPPHQVAGVDWKAELDEQRRDKDAALKKLEDGQRAFDKSEAVWASLRLSIEDKLSEASSMNHRLQAEINKLKSQHSEREQDLHAQIDQLSQQNSQQSSGGEWRERYERLHDDHQHLQRDHQGLQRHHQDLQHDHQEVQRNVHEQQGLADQVRQDTSSMLTEMRALADRGASNGEREGQLVEQIHRLEDELQDWKDRYASATTQAGSTPFHTSSVIPIPNASASTHDASLLRADGLVPDAALTAFHIALESVLRTAHSSAPTAALDRTNAVVAAVRTICHDVPNAAAATDGASQQRAKARVRVAATATNFITAARNFAQARGLSPVSLLDAAASHLAASIVELVRLAGLRPSQGMTEETRARSVASSTTASMKSEPQHGARDARSSEAESIYSNQAAPPSRSAVPASLTSYRDLNQAQRGQPANGASINGAPTNGVSINSASQVATPMRRTPTPNTAPAPKERDPEVEHLKLFLDAQTERLVPAIQALVSSVRTVDEPATLHAHIASIASTVAAILHDTARVADVSPPAAARAAHASLATAVRVLAACRVRLLERDDEGRGIGGHAEWKAYVGTLPPLAFEIAREVKEVARRVEALGEGGEGVMGDDEDEEDFR